MNKLQTEVKPGWDSGYSTSSKHESYSYHKPLDEALRVILKAVDQGVILIDEEFNPVFANDPARNMLAADTAEEAVEAVTKGCSSRIFAEGRERGMAVTYLDIRLPEEGKSKLLGLEIFYHDSLLSTPCYLVLLHDFSNWKKLDELRNRFATSLSHRMRTPLTAARNAVKILSEERESISKPEKEKLLDIGWRSIEKLIANLDELQKIFMIESEEMSVCRTLIRVKNELKPLFIELEREGKIRNFKLKMPDLTIFTGGGRLKDFILTSVDVYGKWTGEAPFIECAVSVREDPRHFGGVNRRLQLSLKPGFFRKRESTGENLRDFLSYREAHLGLVLNRIATALDGELEISASNNIRLFIPLESPFNREKDLIYPLHMMIDRAELTGGEFHLVALRMVGAVNEGARFTKLLDKSLCSCVSSDGIVSKGEEPLNYSIFIINRTLDEVSGMMRRINERFLRSCIESGEEIYPSIRWEIRYSRVTSSDKTTAESLLVEEFV